MVDTVARMANMIVRGVLSVTGSRTAEGGTLAGEAQTDVLVAQPAGFSSNGGDMDAIIVSLNGHSSKRVAVVVMDGTDTQAEPGQLILYSPTRPDQRVVISEDGISVEGDSITVRAETVTVEADDFTWKGKRVAVQGDKDTAGHAIV